LFLANKMTPLDAAMRYAGKLGWPVFPRNGRVPWTKHGWKDASREPGQITEWWRQHPEALIAMPTGAVSGVIVLDIDRKNGKDGFDTLEAIGKSVMPETPLTHTPSGGVHVYFAVRPGVEIRFQPAWRVGLDILGDGGSVALPTPGWDYRWDPHLHPGTTKLVPAPPWFQARKPRFRDGGLDPTQLLQDSCNKIREAGQGARHAVLNREAFLIGCVVARGALQEQVAKHELEAAAASIMASDFNGRQAGRDLTDAFKAGLRKGGQRR
jgi:hypothetical protein